MLMLTQRVALVSLGAPLFLNSKLPKAEPPTGMPLLAKVMVLMLLGIIPPLLVKGGCARMTVSLPSIVPRTPRSVNMSQPMAHPVLGLAVPHVGVLLSALLLGHSVTGVLRFRASERASLMAEAKAETWASIVREPMKRLYWGIAIAARIAEIETTTISSIRVTPRAARRRPTARAFGWWLTWLIGKVW